MWTDCKMFSYTDDRRLKNDFDWILVCKRADWFDIIQVYFPELEIHIPMSTDDEAAMSRWWPYGDWMVMANFRL